MDLRNMERQFKNTEPSDTFVESVYFWVYPYYGLKSKMNENEEFHDDISHFLKWENKHWVTETINDHQYYEFWTNIKALSERYPWVLFYIHGCGMDEDSDDYFMVQAGECLDMGIGLTDIIKQYERDYNGEGMDKQICLEEREF